MKFISTKKIIPKTPLGPECHSCGRLMENNERSASIKTSEGNYFIVCMTCKIKILKEWAG